MMGFHLRRSRAALASVPALGLALALALAACGERAGEQDVEANAGPTPVIERSDEAETQWGVDVREVDPSLLAAPNDAFTAIEPTELGVIGAPTVMQALGGLASPETLEGESAISISVRESGDNAVADVVRENIADDAIAAGHVRIEFRRDVEGWFPVNAYRRSMCRRGANSNQWTAELCP